MQQSGIMLKSMQILYLIIHTFTLRRKNKEGIACKLGHENVLIRARQEIETKVVDSVNIIIDEIYE